MKSSTFEPGLKVLEKKFRFDLARDSIFCCKWHNYFLTGEWRQRSKCELPNAGDPFFAAKLHAWKHKMFKFSSLIYFCRATDHFSLWMLFLVEWKTLPDFNGLLTFVRPTGTQILPPFQCVRPDNVRVQSSSCCFPRVLVSFDPWHVTRSPPIGKRVWVGRYNKTICKPIYRRAEKQ